MVNAKRQTEVHQPCTGELCEQQEQAFAPAFAALYEQAQFGAGIQEGGSFWQGVMQKLENLEDNWGPEVQTEIFCS